MTPLLAGLTMAAGSVAICIIADFILRKTAKLRRRTK
jgi:hypothetical protein